MHKAGLGVRPRMKSISQSGYVSVSVEWKGPGRRASELATSFWLRNRCCSTLSWEK